MRLLEKVLKERNKRRAKRISKLLKKFIKKGEYILDVGSGNATILKQIKEDYNTKVQGIDIIKYNEAEVPFKLFDGKTIPFKDRLFDKVLIIETLHHCDNPINILKEAVRVSKNKIIILEDVYINYLHKRIMYGYDYLMNFRHSVNTPFNFKKEKEWIDIFKKFNLNVIENLDYKGRWYSPMKSRVFILGKQK